MNDARNSAKKNRPCIFCNIISAYDSARGAFYLTFRNSRALFVFV